MTGMNVIIIVLLIVGNALIINGLLGALKAKRKLEEMLDELAHSQRSSQGQLRQLAEHIKRTQKGDKR